MGEFYSLFSHLLFFHYQLYQWFWMNDPVFTDINSKGTFFMRVGALASILLVAVDLLLITYLSKKFVEDSKKPNPNSTDEYMKCKVIADNLKWISGLFLFVNTFIWGFGDFVLMNIK